MSKSNLQTRLDRLADLLCQFDGDAPAQWRELRDRFCAESPINAELVDWVAAEEGARSLPVLLRSQSAHVGQLRRKLGQFCRANRLRCPEAEVVWVRVIAGVEDRSVITTQDGLKFLQLFEVRRDDE